MKKKEVIKEKSSGFIAEFRTFITRGSVIDLAVGVIIGGAFQKIVNSLVNDIIMPIIGTITGGMDFSNFFIVLGDGKFDTLAEAQAAGVATINIGLFITNVINFLIMAFVIFLLIKFINKVNLIAKIKQEEEPEAAPATKTCPFCKTEISIDAIKCPHCTADL